MSFIKDDTLSILYELLERYPCLSTCKEQISSASIHLIECFSNGGKLLLAGNGGSAADCEHISGELTKSFMKDRVVDQSVVDNLAHEYGPDSKEIINNLEGGLPAIPLISLSASLTAFSNDVSPEYSFAQLVLALGKTGDVFIGITTSGNSKNIVNSMKVANAKGMATILLTGASGGVCKGLSDVAICVPETETFKVQELHLPVYHAICSIVENELF